MRDNSFNVPSVNVPTESGTSPASSQTLSTPPSIPPAQQNSALSPPPTGGGKNIAQTISRFLDQLPPLPQSWKEFFIKWYPWWLIIGGILSGISALVGLGLFSFATVITLGGVLAPVAMDKGFIWVAFAAVQSVVSLLGGLGMKKMRKSGWKYAMISEGLDILSSLGGGGGLGLIFSLLFIYFLWQVKDRYT